MKPAQARSLYVMPQHGIEQHLVRPDRVYATGVWSPIVGYQPAEAANQIAARFVSGGQGLGAYRVNGQLFGRTRALARSIALRGPGATFWSWLRERIANVRVRLQVMSIDRETWKARIESWKNRAAGALPPGQTKKVEADTSPRVVGPPGGESPVLMDPAGAAALIQHGSVMSEEKTSAPPLGMALRKNVMSVNDATAYWRGVISSSSGFRPWGSRY